MGNTTVKSKKNNFSAKKNEKGYWDFTCACGSDMWNNIFGQKKSEKSPDLRCKNEDCPHGEGKFPNSVWLDNKQRDALGIKKRVGGSKNSVGDKYNTDIPVSMFAAWAKDIALYLAKAQGLKTADEVDALHRVCLKNISETLNWYKNQAAKTKTPEDQQVKDLDEADDMDESITGSPEDISEDSVEDLDATEEMETETPVDDDFSGLDIDL